jgi:hypothetical protein
MKKEHRTGSVDELLDLLVNLAIEQINQTEKLKGDLWTQDSMRATQLKSSDQRQLKTNFVAAERSQKRKD